uniref:T cell activation RhoGTPase activating protein b n=1 Tax=Xiphophorus couchianus TaxID=32473 RepID=A0A3B5KS02_9TELE
MKVLSGSIVVSLQCHVKLEKIQACCYTITLLLTSVFWLQTKTLTGGGMEQIIVLTPEIMLTVHLSSSETKWNLVRNRMKLRRTSSKACHANKGTKNQLFGQPLSNICPDDYSLPKPITDLLLLLKKRGPSAEGVFRKPCNTRLMKDLREQLDNGTDVDLEGQQVHLLVGLLKCFLKELPHSLLRSDLYNRWTAALDHEDTEQRTLEIRKVLDDLPGPNKLLLQYLVCLFHCILESSDINKMDASNLAVCIGPTLLQLDGTPLDGQREKMQKVETLEMNVLSHFFCFEALWLATKPTHALYLFMLTVSLSHHVDSLSSVHHDSAYDSTDPDGDGEVGEKRSSIDGGRGSSSSYSSLSPSITTSSWQSDAAFDNKAPFNRRCSEPILLLPENLENLCSHARSHDDCYMQRDDFDGQPLKKQISDDSFLLKSRGGASSVFTASNQSESSVFTSSPTGSPRCSKKDNSQPLVTTNGKLDVPRPISEEKRRSQSMRVASKVLMRTRSLGAFSRNSLKKDAQKENSFPETLQEDSQSEADPSADVLSAIEVFKQVDSRLPSRPPSYEQAVQNIAPPPHYGSMTVQDAITRSRPSSMNYDLPVREYLYNQDCFSQMAQDTVVEQRQPFRQRAMSESVSKGQHEMVSRRCVQPVFEEFSYAKESYV